MCPHSVKKNSLAAASSMRHANAKHSMKLNIFVPVHLDYIIYIYIYRFW